MKLIIAALIGISIVVSILTFVVVDRSPSQEPSSMSRVQPDLIIHMNEDGYNPNRANIKKNQAGSFVNDSASDKWPASNIHPTHDIYPLFDPRHAIKPGESWIFVFDKPGVWFFHDHLFPAITGSVTVSE